MSDILQLSEPNIREIMLNLVDNLPNKVGVCLSSGIDSRCIAFALLDSGRKVHAYSFTLADRVSRDCKVAEDISKEFGFEFTKIVLPTDLNVLKQDIIKLHYDYGCKKKTEYECVWPFLYVYPLVTESVLANGIRADSHFCISKRARLHFKDDLDAYRLECFNSPNGGQILQHTQLANENGIELFVPYRSDDMINYFMGKTYDECNKPHQKQPILNSFPEYFSRYAIYPHTNFQLGDSGISDLFNALVSSDWNMRNHKSIVGILNAVNKGELGIEKYGHKKRKLI